MFSRRPGTRFNRGRVSSGAGSASGPAAPTISAVANSIATAVGDTAGGYTVTVTGTGFSGGGLTAVTFDAAAATSLVVVNDTTATCTVPAGASAGQVNVSVTGPGGSNSLTNGWRYWDPSAVTLTGWYRDDRAVTGSDVTAWNDKTGANNLAAGAARPQVGAALNGHETIDFTGAANCFFFKADAISEWIANNAYTIYAVVNPDAINTDSATPYSNDAVVADTGQFWGLHLRTTGPTAQAYNWDGSEDTATKTITTGAWQVLEQIHGGGNITLRLNNGAVATTASGNTTDLTGAMRIGTAVAGTLYDGKMAEIILANTAFDATTSGYARAYLITRYAITP